MSPIKVDIPEPNPSGICQCGCGESTPIASQSHSKFGHVIGKPMRFIRGHNNRGRWMKDMWKPEDRGYDTPCWIWQGSRNAHGYGRVVRKPKQLLAHRLVFEQLRGPIPDGLTLDHLCRVPACVNPDHLEPVTPAVNNWRGRGTKLLPEEAEEIIASDEDALATAIRFGISRTHVYTLRRGYRPKYLLARP